ncbi:MAG: aminopeptidase P family protein [Chloroflexota bacterium]|nr:aminopeptidase P family protein [Chloroflexota bacterium]
MEHADYTARLAQTRQRIAEAGLDGLLVTSQYNRRYLTGFTAADHDITDCAGMALVTPGSFGLITSTFFLNGVEDEIKPSGVTPLLTDRDTTVNTLARALRDVGGVKKLGFEKEWMSYSRYTDLQEGLGKAVKLVPADDMVEAVRAGKDAAELATIRRAADIANRAFAALLEDIRVGMTEREIGATLDRHMVALGAEGPSFDTIVACGPGGALPHWVPSDRPARAGEPLLIDFGCRVDGYCSDLTRTIVIGKPDAKLREIYGIVRDAQDAALEALRTGARTGREMDAAARKVIDDAGYGKEFMHSLGHGVGLAVHELPAVSHARTPEAEAALAKIDQLEPGSVITNEPGIYIAGWGGVRLEDMIHVGKQRVEVLTDRNPKRIVSIAG